MQEKTAKPMALDLEVETLEVKCRPGCGSSTTSTLCTCPIRISTTVSDLTGAPAR